MNIMNNEVFSVHPRTGYLEPSEVTTITLSFKLVASDDVSNE